MYGSITGRDLLSWLIHKPIRYGSKPIIRHLIYRLHNSSDEIKSLLSKSWPGNKIAADADYVPMTSPYEEEDGLFW